MKETRISLCGLFLASAMVAPICAATLAPADRSSTADQKAAPEQVKKDSDLLTADKKAVKTACREAGADCDAAKAKLKADQDRLKAGTEKMKKAGAPPSRDPAQIQPDKGRTPNPVQSQPQGLPPSADQVQPKGLTPEEVQSPPQGKSPN